jgi:hypothetical protein
MRKALLRRQATAQVQWIVVAALLVIALFAGIAAMGTATKAGMNTVAQDVGDPTKLTKQFGS